MNIKELLENPKSRCVNCAFANEQQLPPPNLGKQLVCLWGPPQVNVLPAGPGQMQMNMAFPIVQPGMVCGRFAMVNPKVVAIGPHRA